MTWRRILLTLFACGLAVAQDKLTLPAPTSTTAYDPYFSEGRGYWERDRLIYVHIYPETRIDLYDKDTFRSAVKVTVPDSRDVSLTDATITKDGHLIVSGCYFPQKGQIHCFVGAANAEGRVSPMIDTGHFSPKQVAACDNDTVWAMGWLRTGPELDREALNEPYHVLREYRLADGRIVSSALERTTFPRVSWPAFSGHDFPDLTMRCTGKLLGIYEGASDEWIEYDLASKTLNRWKLPKQDHPWAEQDEEGKILPKPKERTRVSGIAMLDSGDVYASFVRLGTDFHHASVGLFRLEKKGNRGDWINVDGTLAPFDQRGAFDQLNGTDGVHLVYSRFGEPGWFFSAAPR